MSTGKLKNMKFKASHFWSEKRPTKNFEDRIPTMLGPANISQDTPGIRCMWVVGRGVSCIHWQAVRPWASCQIRKIVCCSCAWNAGVPFLTDRP